MRSTEMTRFNSKFGKFKLGNVPTSVINYRYGELTGMLDTMLHCKLLSFEEYQIFINDVNKIYSYLMDEERDRFLNDMGGIIK